MARYKITATIFKAGQEPTEWTYFSKERLTEHQCIKKFSNGKKDMIQLDNFGCARV